MRKKGKMRGKITVKYSISAVKFVLYRRQNIII